MATDGKNLRAENMRELFSYVKRFHGGRFVIKIEGGLIDDELLPALVQDLSLLAGVGIRLLVVVGAREKIDSVLRTYGIETKMIDGIRISPPEALPLIEMAAFDNATKIMTRLTGRGLDAVIGNWVRARTAGVRNGVDFQNTGDVERIDPG